jgi:WD40 repeat protein
LTGHAELVSAVALGEVDGEPIVVSGSHDGSVMIWKARKQKFRYRVLVEDPVEGLAVTNGSAVAIATDRGLVVVDLLVA